MGGAWRAYDAKASWVAVFLLLILWWLSHVPRMFTRRTKLEEGESPTTVSGHSEEDEMQRKFKMVYGHFRDGTMYLLAAVAIDTIAAGPYGATNALAWIFTGFWIILGGMLYFFKWQRVYNLLAFLDLVLVIALISNAFAHPRVRSVIYGS